MVTRFRALPAVKKLPSPGCAKSRSPSSLKKPITSQGHIRDDLQVPTAPGPRQQITTLVLTICGKFWATGLTLQPFQHHLPMSEVLHPTAESTFHHGGLLMPPFHQREQGYPDGAGNTSLYLKTHSCPNKV